MGLFNRKAKCRQFYKLESSTIDVKGLQATLPKNIKFGFGSFTIDKKYVHATEKLQMLDIMQFQNCQSINLIHDKTRKDDLIIENSRIRNQMIEIIIKLNGNVSESAIPDVFHFAGPDGLSFEQLATAIAKADNTVVDLSELSAAQRAVVLPSTDLKTASAQNALEKIRFLSSNLPDYNVNKENGVYKITIKP